MGRVRRIAILGLAALVAAPMSGPVRGEGLRLRLSYSGESAGNRADSLDAALGFGQRLSGTAGARLMWRGSVGALSFDAALDLSIRRGDNVAYQRALRPFLPTVAPATLFDLSGSWSGNATTVVRRRIDRLSVGFAGETTVVKLGRQAITWGSGMVFHPADIVAPFAPNTIDTTYKPGADMLYAQMLFDSGADLQLVAVPRPISRGGPVAFSASTYALRLHGRWGDIDTNLMLARDHADTVGTLGLSGALGGASWNVEAIDWALQSGENVPSWLLNISNFGTLWGHNVSTFAEFYHNGFGVDASVPLAALPSRLTRRMSTGQVFLAGRNFLALGLNVQVGADATLAPNAIVSLDDHSILAGLTFDYALGDNVNIRFNYSQPVGGGRTEFGGRETAPGSGVFARPATLATLQVIRFF